MSEQEYATVAIILSEARDLVTVHEPELRNAIAHVVSKAIAEERASIRKRLCVKCKEALDGDGDEDACGEILGQGPEG